MSSVRQILGVAVEKCQLCRHEWPADTDTVSPVRQILGVAVEKCQLSHPVSSRVAGCKLIGKMATKFDPYTSVLPLSYP